MLLTTRKTLIIKFLLILFLFYGCGDDTEIDDPLISEEEEEVVVVEEEIEDFKNYTWNQQGQTIEDIQIPFFGGSMDMNAIGDKFILGSADAPSACGNFCNGVTRVYDFKGGIWTQINDDLYGDLIGDADFIGYDVAIDGAGDFIAASYQPFTGGIGKYITRVFNQVNDNWVQVGTDIINFSGLGSYVSINTEGNILVVAMSKNNSDDLVKVYRLINNDWKQIGEDIKPGEFYNQVSLNSKGDILMIGQSLFSAKVKFYHISENGWTFNEEIKGTLEDKPLNTDYKFSSDGNTIVLGGGFKADCNNCSEKPRIQVYTRVGNDWKQKGQEITWQEEGYNINNEEAVAINQNGNRIAIGLKRIKKDSPTERELFVLVFQYSDAKNEWQQIPTVHKNGKLGGVWSLDMNDEGDILAVGVDLSGRKSVEVFKLEPLK
ncbi:hypothetical protein ACSTS3_03265 [Aquimarina muelleri]|uniref:hypothetical protein n=1 Tax=Aquimarina muelleri TaxID=279356 RepID=UPI003F686DDC